MSTLFFKNKKKDLKCCFKLYVWGKPPTWLKEETVET